MPMLKAGDTAPDFSVQAHTGETVKLSNLRGKWVVLWFYPKASTPGCTAEGCGFRDKSTDYRGKNAVILGVSFDSVVANKAFAEKFDFPYQLLCDTDRTIGIAYGAADDANASTPRRISYLIDPYGKIKQVWSKVDVKIHAADVLSYMV